MNHDEIIMEPKKKEKNYTVFGVLLVLCILVATSFLVVNTYPGIWSRMEKDRENYPVEYLDHIDYSLYIKLMEAKTGTSLQPNDVIIPGLTKEVALEKGIYDQVFEYIEASISNTNYLLEKDYFNYCIQDLETKTILEKNANDPLAGFLTEPFEDGIIANENLFLASISYDASGNLRILTSYGFEENDLAHALNSDTFSEHYKDYFGEDSEEYLFCETLNFEKPKNMQMVIGITADYFSSSDYKSYITSNYNEYDFLSYGFFFVLLVASIFIGLMGLVLPCIKRLKIGRGFALSIPFELNVLALFLLCGCSFTLSFAAFTTANGGFVNELLEQHYSASSASTLAWSINLSLWVMFFGAIFVITTSLKQVFTLGLKRYLKEKVLGIILFRWFLRKINLAFQTITAYDFNEPVNKIVLKIVGVNFIILLVMISVWFSGIPLLIIYSIVLFYFIEKYLKDTKSKHKVLLQATRNIANGNLEVDIAEDLGVFNPLKEELLTIKDGFKKAVDEEVKSQQMKTELITNVSHDLKTPLTAIITYIDLLKDDAITKEQQTEYIQTLERKSLRLKKLIEDLFEVSKINSNNIEVTLGEVDIVSLIKQVHSELEDQITESSLQFKFDLPEEKIILQLDGQKTYRIFENLYINILKYAMPSTRAYVEVRDTPQEVIITLKNISQEELNFNKEEITERFVRGDMSRNTEGSGLGLAIVKSFVQVQGGKFVLEVDGDLFKAMIIFYK